jgi:predicted nucleic acid-binding protein
LTVVDASVWVSRLVSRDVYHEISRTWLAHAVARGDALIAPALLLAEVAGAVSRRTAEPGLGRRATEILIRVPGLRLVPIDRRPAHEAARLATRLGLRGADATYVATARLMGIPLVTWDREQRERAGRSVAVRTPGEIGDSAP